MSPLAEPAARSESRAASAGICGGFRVLEIATMLAGPLAGQILGDLGAEIIKVESPLGDPTRAYPPVYREMSAFFQHANRNKKSITIDLKKPEGAALARRLALSSDVLLENFRPGVLDRMGLGYDSLKGENPGLIYASVSGFGIAGPESGRATYDPVIQAVSGFMQLQARNGTPQATTNPIVDKITGISAASAILGALLYRERNGGIGQRVCVSMLDAFAAFALPDQLGHRSFPGGDSPRLPEVDGYRSLRTSDGWIISLIITNAQFQSACKVFKREDLATDERFIEFAPRVKNLDAMWDAFAKSALSLTTKQIAEAAAELSLPLGIVNTIDQFMNEPQVLHNGVFVDFDDARVGTMRHVKHPANFEKSPAQLRSRSPFLGEHSREILQGIGLDETEIDRCFASGIVK